MEGIEIPMFLYREGNSILIEIFENCILGNLLCCLSLTVFMSFLLPNSIVISVRLKFDLYAAFLGNLTHFRSLLISSFQLETPM